MARQSHDRLEQAATWHIALNEGPLGASENENFLDWLAEDENARAFNAVSRSWEVSGQAHGHIAIEQWLEEARNRPAAEAGAGWRPPVWAAAASVLLALVISAIFFVGFADGAQQYSTNLAERRTLTLDDGTRVSLDADSVIEVTLSDSAREVIQSKGRAQFDVAKDTARPFTVFSGDQAITATGTSFTVETFADETRVVLLEGEVEVTRIDPPKAAQERVAQKVTLRPGDLFVAQKGVEERPVVSQTDLADASSWQSGYLTFESEPLTNVTSRFNRYSRDKLEIDDRAAGDIRISGTYKADDVSAFLEGLEAIHNVQATRRDDAIGLTLSSTISE
ncbi:MAG: FecR domain-containing protein [Pseudomonadota bacterium]